MAAISELSMYQATAMRLQQQRAEAQEAVDRARERLEQGLPPTDDADYIWAKMERDRVRRHEALMEKVAQERIQMVNAAKIARGLATNTTATQRVNSYIPPSNVIKGDVAIPASIPTPYGALAPFKPQALGATMRHIRKPVPREIEL